MQHVCHLLSSDRRPGPRQNIPIFLTCCCTKNITHQKLIQSGRHSSSNNNCLSALRYKWADYYTSQRSFVIDPIIKLILGKFSFVILVKQEISSITNHLHGRRSQRCLFFVSTSMDIDKLLLKKIRV